MIANITPAECNGQFWVRIRLDGSELERRGPFANADDAEVRPHGLPGFVARCMPKYICKRRPR